MCHLVVIPCCSRLIFEKFLWEHHLWIVYSAGVSSWKSPQTQWCFVVEGKFWTPLCPSLEGARWWLASGPAASGGWDCGCRLCPHGSPATDTGSRGNTDLWLLLCTRPDKKWAAPDPVKGPGWSGRLVRVRTWQLETCLLHARCLGRTDLGPGVSRPRLLCSGGGYADCTCIRFLHLSGPFQLTK